LQYMTSAKEVTNWCTNTVVPHDLTGRFVVAGPAMFEFNGQAFGGVLDAFGKVQRYTLTEGSLCISSRMLQSGFYNESMKLGHVNHGLLFTETVPPRDKCPMWNPMCNELAPMDNNFVNNALYGDTMVMITDSVATLNYDLEAMEVTGTRKWDDDITNFMHAATLSSGHPVRGDNAWYEIVTQMSMLPHGAGIIDVVKIHDDKPNVREVVTSVEVPHTYYMHSFGITQNYAILPLNVIIDTSHNATGSTMKPFWVADWHGVVVLDLHAPKVVGTTPPVMVFKPEQPILHVHIINTYEEDDRIVMDMPYYMRSPFVESNVVYIDAMRNKTVRDEKSGMALSQLSRVEMFMSGPKKGQTEVTPLAAPNRLQDFTKINNEYHAKKYCYSYFTEWYHNDKDFGNMAIGKLNVCGDKPTTTYWHHDNVHVSEALFIPKEGGVEEDDGYLMFHSLHGEEGKTHFTVLDAKDLSTVMDVVTPEIVPFTAHGEFYPTKPSAKAVSSAKAILV